jgi:hypothetical protein
MIMKKIWWWRLSKVMRKMMVMIKMTTKKKMIFIVEKGIEYVVRTVLTNWINVEASKIIRHITTVR